MAGHSKRVSKDKLAATIAAAVALERERIEQIEGADVDQVNGGYVQSKGSTDYPTGGTMGYFPPPTDTSN